ncbi:hypothetical protein [Lactococcus phage P1046]|uniref:Uncharacterized protein n=1 Tax=Lactococcus phage P1046 TaxID=2662294 RepID=A0A649V1N9_9CAUD|nr:hypothetical protein [Lactococcus phage P1046]
MIKIEDIVLDGKESNSSGRQMPAMTEEEKDILQHHGVIGMRWGKGRKTKVPKQTVAPKAKGVNESAREQQFKSEYANRDKMSTRSLQNRVKRLQAEQQFKELVNKPAAERAKAAAAIAEKKRKRNKMLLRTALGIYGNVPMDSFGKKGKDLKEILGPSQAIAKAASSSDALKNGETLDNILLHKGVKGMKWHLKNAALQDGVDNDASVNQQVDTLNQQIAVEKDPKKKAFLEASLSKYKKPNAENANAEITRSPQETRDALVKGVDTIKKNIAKETDPSKLAELKKSLKIYNSNIAKVNTQMGADKSLAHSFEKQQGKNMSINKNDVILHSSTGVGLHELHHGFKYKSKHQNKKGLTKKITGTVNARKKGTIHKTYDSVLKKLGF